MILYTQKLIWMTLKLQLMVNLIHQIQTFGNARYLVFKLNDESDTEEGILIEDPEKC